MSEETAVPGPLGDAAREVIAARAEPYMHTMTDAEIALIEQRFTYHPPQPGQIERYALLRASAKHFAEVVLECVPEGREQSLALTKVQEAVMWANAGIAMESEPREPQP